MDKIHSSPYNPFQRGSDMVLPTTRSRFLHLPVMLLMLVFASCSLPDPKPLPEDACQGCGDSSSAECDLKQCNPDCGAAPDVAADIKPELEIVPDLPDLQPEVDVVDVPDELEEIETVDVPTCSAETECKTAGVCKDVVAVCNFETLEWVCDYDSVVGLEWGGEVTCDGEDNDCDGEVDEGFGTTTCGKGPCLHTIDNCVDGVSQECDDFEGASDELCDGLDNDCDGDPDNGVCTLCELGGTTCVGTQYAECMPDGNSYDTDNPISCDSGLACMGEGVCTPTEAFRVNEYLPSTQNNPAVAVVGSNIVVAWESLGQDGDDLGVYFKLLDEVGDPEVGETAANLYTLKEQQAPAVVALDDDTFVIGWESSQQDGSEGTVMARVFGPTGVGGAEMMLNETTAGHQGVPAFTTLPGGGALAVWSGEVPAAQIGIYARKISSVGWPLGGEELFTSGTQTDTSPIVGMVGADAVVAWQRGILDLNIQARVCPETQLPCMQVDKDISVSAEEEEYRPGVAVSNSSVLISWSELVSTKACWVVCDSSLSCAESKCVPDGGPVVTHAVAGNEQGLAVLWLEDTGATTQALRLAPLAEDGTLEPLVDVKLTELPYVFPGDAGISLALLPGGKAVVAWSADDGSGSDDIWAQFVQLDFPEGE